MRVRLGMLWILLGSAAASAADLNLEAQSPAIQKIKQTMAERVAQYSVWKDFGYLGEGRDGYLAIRLLEGIRLAEKKQIEDMVAAENADRRMLYQELARANGLAETELARVLAAAGRARRAASAPGHWVQHPQTGQWLLAREVKD